MERAITKLGRGISLARRRRQLMLASLAERIGASLVTVRRLEKGDPCISLYFMARALHVFGELERLNQLLDTGEDAIGLELTDEQLPQRVRTRKAATHPGAL